MSLIKWDDLGLKMGLEIHQQLNTSSKLFCSCAAELVDEKFDERIIRNLRPTQNELGQIDRAAMQESLKKTRFSYDTYNYHTCLVETDDEPPHDLNQEALETSMIIAILLNMKIVDEFHTMRKQVIDGSNTGGFQRSVLVATDGYLETPNGRVIIENLCLEEDASRRIAPDTQKNLNGETEDHTHFRLDRLGIPLVEITTDHAIHHPEQIKEVAYSIGQILRSSNVKRGIGTIRQDLNISIAKGARCEIKGVQNLNLMNEIIKREIQRQLKLVEIKEELGRRNAQVLDEIHDLSLVFKDSSSKIISSAGSVQGVVLKGFGGLIGEKVQKGRIFGTEISDYAKKRGVSRIFHTDELPSYDISEKEVQSMKEYLSVGEDDAIIIVAHCEDIVTSALEEVIKRANMAFQGVIEETRKSLGNGNTEYMRPLSTSSRMYPETDIPLLKSDEESIEKIKNNLPELPDIKKKRLISQYGLSEDLSKQLVIKHKADEFEGIITEISQDIDVTTIASVLVYDLIEIKRKSYDISVIDRNKLIDVFKLLSDSKISKDALTKIIIGICENPKEDVEKIVKDKNLLVLDEENVKKIIREIVAKNSVMVEERKMGAIGSLMGISMKELKGQSEGKVVNKILKEEIKKLI